MTAVAGHGWGQPGRAGRAEEASSVAGLHSPDGPGAGTPARLRAAAQAAAAAHRLDRPGRRRAARGRAREAVHQEGREGLGARARDPLLRPDDARGPGHAGQGRRALLEGDPARPERPERSVGRRRLRLSEPRRDREGAPRGHRRQGRERRDVLPVRPGAARRQAARRRGRRRAGRRRGRHGDRPRRVPLGPLREGLRRDRAGQGSVRRRAPEGDPRGRRARHLRQRAPRLAARDGGRRRLHQDLHRQAARARRRCRCSS